MRSHIAPSAWKYAHHVGAHPGHGPSGHWLRPRSGMPATHVGMVGAAVVADEEALVLVRPGRLVHRRGALHRGVHRQVADIVLVELQPQLFLERQRVKPARGGEGARRSASLRHAVAGAVEEADILAGMPDLRGDGFEPAGSPRNAGRNRSPGSPASLPRAPSPPWLLKMFIGWLLLAGEYLYPVGARSCTDFRRPRPPGLAAASAPRSWSVATMKIAVSARNGTRDFECDAGEKILHAAPAERRRAALRVRDRHLRHLQGPARERAARERVARGARPPLSQERGRAPDVPERGPRGLPARGRGALKPGEAETCRAAGARRRDTRPTGGSPTTWSPSTSTSTQPLDFAAGQFALLTVPGIAGARAYSMVNFDRRAQRLSFVVKKKPGGAVSEWLFRDGVEGARLGVFAPLGHATFRPGLAKHLLCIAGGSGIAGMMSILSRAGQEGHFSTWDGHVFFGVRTERDCFFLDELEALRARHPARLAVTVALSDEDVPPSLTAAYPSFALRPGLRPRGGGRAHEGTLHRRSRLRRRPAADGRREPAPLAAGGAADARRHPLRQVQLIEIDRERSDHGPVRVSRLRVHER